MRRRPHKAAAAPLPPAALVLLGLAVHLVLTYSVIDIHFQSPVLHGIPPQPMDHPGPAQRVVVLVADGLRADKLFEPDGQGRSRSPFLRQRALLQGRFGISHTRPPTESRPGHVAMLAGFYEDPSALFSGWQANPVSFDSVFAHAAAAWGFGSPDVVPMFEGQGVYAHDAYDPSLEDFGRADLAVLDAWAFNRTRAFLDEVRADLGHPFRTGPALLFVHLLGLDSNAHAHGGPAAPQYLANIRFVDDQLAGLVAELEGLLPDGATAYLYTADHGMSDQASHGDGAPENTETPYVVWGAGVAGGDAGAEQDAAADVPTPEWGYQSPLRLDIEQAQLTPLIAALLGTPTPVNSIGLLPRDLLAGDPALRAHAAWANARQLLAAHDRREEAVQRGRLAFRPYGRLAALRGPAMRDVRFALHLGEHAMAEERAAALAAAAVRGIEYLQRYDWAPLMAVVTLAFLGWMAFLGLQLALAATAAGAAAAVAAAAEQAARASAGAGAGSDGGASQRRVRWHSDVRPRAAGDSGSPPPRTRRCTPAPRAGAQASRAATLRLRVAAWLTPARAAGVAVVAAGASVLLRMSAPATYYAYLLLPCAFWAEVAEHRVLLEGVVRRALAAPGMQWGAATELPAAVALLLGMAAGFKQRELYALLMPAAALLAALSSPARGRAAAWRLVGAFCAAGGFALAPTSKQLDTPLVLASGAAAAAWVLLSTQQQPAGPRVKGAGAARHRYALLTAAQLAAVAVALLVAGLTRKGAPQPVLRACAWAVYLSGPVLPLLSPPEWRRRWRALLLGLLAPFILVSICWEPLFLAATAAAVDAWVRFDAASRAAAAEGAAAAAGAAAATPQRSRGVRQRQGLGSDDERPSTPPGSRGAQAAALPDTPVSSGRVTRAQARAAAAAGQAAWGDAPCVTPLPPSSLKGGRRAPRTAAGREAAASAAAAAASAAAAGWADLPAALLFLLLIQMGFFGQGQTATIASFDLASVYRLVTVFNPFVMAAILLGKLFIPFLLAACGCAALAKAAGRRPFGLYVLVLLLSDVMSLKFFFDVRSTGSWMEIGSSLGFYGILNAQVVVVLLLFSLAQVYVRGVQPDAAADGGHAGSA